VSPVGSPDPSLSPEQYRCWGACSYWIPHAGISRQCWTLVLFLLLPIQKQPFRLGFFVTLKAMYKKYVLHDINYSPH
jgi:hypothetical protein